MGPPISEGSKHEELGPEQLFSLRRESLNSLAGQGPESPAIASQQGLYLAASGTLTQFNSILAAIHGALLSALESGALKTAVVVALAMHVLSPFILCRAARPIEHRQSCSLRASLKSRDDTFRNYRRGWRMTLLALTVSSLAAALYVLHTFGVAPPSLRPFLAMVLPS